MPPRMANFLASLQQQVDKEKGALFDIEKRYGELNVDKNKSIVAICTMGGRSRLAAESLSKLEFTNVYNMVGGLNEWYKVYGESNYD